MVFSEKNWGYWILPLMVVFMLVFAWFFTNTYVKPAKDQVKDKLGPGWTVTMSARPSDRCVGHSVSLPWVATHLDGLSAEGVMCCGRSGQCQYRRFLSD